MQYNCSAYPGHNSIGCSDVGRVVVVGAGVGGLATAVRLADLGHDVVVLERRGDTGGQLRAGVPGPTTFTLPAVFRDLFGTTGRRMDLELTLRPVDPAVRYVTSEGVVVLPHASRGGTLRAFRDALGDTAASDWDRLMRRAADVWEATRSVLVDRLPTTRSIAALALRPTSRHAAFGTLGALLADLDITHPAVREIVAAHAIGLGAHPVTGPAIVATRPYLEQTFGVWTVDGGPGALVDALTRRAEERGAVIRTSTAAARYETHRRRMVAVHTGDGDRLPADVVVSTVPDAEHHRLLGRPPTSARGARSVLSIVLPDAGPAPGGDAVRTVFTRTDDDPQCVVEYPEHPAGGGVVIHVDVDRHPTGHDDATRDVLAGLRRRGLELDEPGAARVVTPDRWADDLALGDGSPYGPTATGRWSTLRRLSNRTPVRGLYRVGAATHPGPGVHAVALSAAIVADLVGRSR